MPENLLIFAVENVTISLTDIANPLVLKGAMSTRQEKAALWKPGFFLLAETTREGACQLWIRNT